MSGPTRRLAAGTGERKLAEDPERKTAAQTMPDTVPVYVAFVLQHS
jgi:hypothetical protein